jgi:hypothetical protein
MGWIIQGLNPSEARLSAPLQTGPWAHPASCTCTGSLPQLGGGTENLPPSSTEVKEWVQPYLYSPSGRSWPVIACTLPFTCTEVVLQGNLPVLQGVLKKFLNFFWKNSTSQFKSSFNPVDGGSMFLQNPCVHLHNCMLPNSQTTIGTIKTRMIFILPSLLDLPIC